ncbi:MAG: single-stranded DNA-binding protein [Planctomycetota bacterium]|nr:single-stranded DNA-binding protein [Planctomycetota bacterium]
MASYNRVILMGNLCRDVELKYTPGGLAVTEISLAVNDKRKTAGGEWVEEVTFVDCTLFGRTAEIAGEYLAKGSPVFLEGRLKLDTWEKDGQKRSKMRVVCDKMQLIGGRSGGEGGVSRAKPQASSSNTRYPEASSQMDATHEHHEVFEEESPLPF